MVCLPKISEINHVGSGQLTDAPFELTNAPSRSTEGFLQIVLWCSGRSYANRKIRKSIYEIWLHQNSYSSMMKSKNR